VPPPDPTALAAHWEQLRGHPLQSHTWLELAHAYASAGLAPQAAYAAGQFRRLRPGEGTPVLPAAPAATADGIAGVSVGSTPAAAAADALLLHPEAMPARAWAAALEGWLKHCPGDWLSWLYLARLQDGTRQAVARSTQAAQQPRQDPAPVTPNATALDEALLQAEALEPIPGESRHWLGVWRLGSGDAAGAVAALAPLIDRQPPRHGSLLQLGLALLRNGNRAAAEAAFSRASASTNPAFLRLLAQRVYEHNYWQEAIAVLERALNLVPDDLASLVALARLHWEVYHLSEAEALCQRVLALDPANIEVPYLLNALPGRRGDARAHLAAVEAHYASLGDPCSRLASSIAMASLYVDDRTPEEIADLHRRLCAPIEACITNDPITSDLTPSPITAGGTDSYVGPAPPASAEHNGFSRTKPEPSNAPDSSPDTDPERPLRIGLVSGDFHRQHPVNLFMLPLLERLDRQLFPVWVFHTGSMHDEYTARARAAAHRWIEAAQLDDTALRQRIQAERIDILIDLAGHTSSHRLGVFALRAAPVQATFLGYPHSTGLSRIDWLIGDAVVSPAEHAHLFSEGIAQLPGSVFCWRPVDDYPLPPARPTDAPLVLGSFNNIMKLSPRTIHLWAALLRDLPEATLLLKAPSLGDASVVERFTGLFATEGIATDRLRFEGPSELGEMMHRYGAIDIALDPTPYNGGTTTLQALWMGVPVISLLGGNFVSRMGASFLAALGRPEWIASDETHYRAIVRQLVAQLPAIRQGRTELRQQMAASGLSDLDCYSRRMEYLLRRMWQHHGNNHTERLLAAGD
jgi:predicted O-linked N-acetylglucosamine transferase (SPINDLY family)